jgi:hypothetical protein
MPRPVAAGVLTIIGGFFILFGGLVIALIGVFVLAFFHVAGWIFLLGVFAGLVTLIAGLLMLLLPAGHTVWGALAIVMALVSIPAALGGFIIGFLLALAGGILAISWKPPVSRVITTQGRTIPPTG